MNILGRVTVLPRVPDRIKRLNELAYNLYWTYQPKVQILFERLSPELWEATGHNPVKLLRDISQDRLDVAAQASSYLALYDEVCEAFDAYLHNHETWFRTLGHAEGQRYAYFCAEYGWHEVLPLYSGGLGVLAGDHTKAASDLGVPLVGIGLWYPEGYFHQRVAADGQQEAVYQRLNPLDLPLGPVRDKQGNEVRISVNIMGNNVEVRAWKVQVGRVPVYLLDTDVPENNPADRAILARLYGGDQRTRIAQEIILGIGGMRMLRALRIEPTMWHMNEGHSAFMALERCRELVEQQGLSFDEAREVVAAGTTFTVHTPVSAGNDAFPFDLMSQFFGGYWGSLGLSQGQFFDLARHDHGWGAAFSMTALALRFTSARNGVAELHGHTSRRIWNDMWPEVPTDEVPIGHVTNGVHRQSWVAPEIAEIVAKVLPPDWRKRITDEAMWQESKKLDNAELWEVRQRLKSKSVSFLRQRVFRQLARHGASPTEMHYIDQLFDPKALTIGFARRFATYKRATLIFHDLERLDRILNRPSQPVQLVFSGKAHPADRPGQDLIAAIHNLSHDPRFRGKILFIEDYDIAIGRALTRGADVWLNNPRRPNEASGTSGQKAAMNGILNLSILDGWWPEGFNGDNGWAIGGGISRADPDQADAADADALYNLLEREVVPLYYERDEKGIAQRWLERSKEAIASCTPRFSARRMLQDYVRDYYIPASERATRMAAGDYARAKELASWRRHIMTNWHSIYFTARAPQDSVRTIGDEIEIEATLNSRLISPEELCIELVYSAETDGLKHDLYTAVMCRVENQPDGNYLYRVRFAPKFSGRIAYGVRVYPIHPDLVNPFDLGLIRWA